MEEKFPVMMTCQFCHEVVEHVESIGSAFPLFYHHDCPALAKAKESIIIQEHDNVKDDD